MGDDQLAEAFVRVSELAEASGVVPDDGSGIDGTWTTSLEDPDTGTQWHIALNADLDDERQVDLPDPHAPVTLGPGRAAVFYGDTFGPVAVFTPTGGRMRIDGRDPTDGEEGDLPQSTEAQFIHAVKAETERRAND